MIPPIEVPISVETLQVESVNEGREVARLVRILVSAVRRPLTLAMAAHIHRDDMEAVLEVARQRVERLRRRGVAVYTHHRRHPTLPHSR